MSFPAIVRRGLSLPTEERSGFLKAYAALGWTDLVLRLRGFDGATRGIVPVSASAASKTLDSIDIEKVNQYVRWIKAAARYHVVRARCLHESLTLHRWLRQDDLPSELRIGVRMEDGALKAHAWVELFSQVVNDPPSAVAGFRPLNGLDGQAATWGTTMPSMQAFVVGRS